jgi:hypothetical protein
VTALLRRKEEVAALVRRPVYARYRSSPTSTSRRSRAVARLRTYSTRDEARRIAANTYFAGQGRTTSAMLAVPRTYGSTVTTTDRTQIRFQVVPSDKV